MVTTGVDGIGGVGGVGDSDRPEGPKGPDGAEETSKTDGVDSNVESEGGGIEPNSPDQIESGGEHARYLDMIRQQLGAGGADVAETVEGSQISRIAKEGLSSVDDAKIGQMIDRILEEGI